MLFALGAASAASTAIGLLSSLQQSSGTSKATSRSDSAADSVFAAATSGTPAPAMTPLSGPAPAAGGLSPDTLGALISEQGKGPRIGQAHKHRDEALKDLFAQLDGDGDGSITKTEFEDKLGAGGTNLDNADSVFAKMDADGDGNISLDEMSTALKSKGGEQTADGTGFSPDGSSAIDKLIANLEEVPTPPPPGQGASPYEFAQRIAQMQVPPVSITA